MSVDGTPGKNQKDVTTLGDEGVSPKALVAAMGKLAERIPGAFFAYTADEPEAIFMVNRAAIELLGCDDLDDFMKYTGGTFKGLVHPDDLEATEASIVDQIGDSGEGVDCLEYRIIRKDGAVRWVRDYGQLVDSEDGRVFYVYLYDATAEKHEEETLRYELAQQRMLVSYIESNTDIASVLDLEKGTFRAVTQGASYDGAKEGEIQSIFDKSVLRVVPECRDEYAKTMNIDAIRKRFADGADSFSFQTFFQNEDGSVSRKLNTYYAAGDERRYVLAVREDTTTAYEREQAIAKAREAAEELKSPASDFIEEMIHRQGKRRLILAVDDSELNREIMKEILSAKYDVVFAENGMEALGVLAERASEIDLILLDIYMPVCDGFEFLERARKNPQYAVIPVVVATGSSHAEDEERCLRLGAVDFITKPYEVDTMMACIKRAIRMSASASSISAFEFDSLTGLYTLPAFLFHADRRLAEGGLHSIALVDVRDFGMLNSIHGERACDDVLRFMSSQLKESLPDSLIARVGGRFHILSSQDQISIREAILDHVSKVRRMAPVPNIRLRIGLCFDIDGDVSASTMCDRAKMAVESIVDDALEQVVIYDDGLKQKRARELKMLSRFDEAIEQHRFCAWIQPKVDSVTGEVVAGEALVRWVSEQGKMISPGEFIPLFEREGCIDVLDEYIFREVCKYQRERLDAGKKVVPISVNLSRNSLFGGGVLKRYGSIAEEMGVYRKLIPLEITESAATSDSAITRICENFVKAGFSLHVDDFGTGYSSLSSLADLPFDVLKLDKSLVDRIGTEKGAVVIKNAVDTAKDLGMNVVAEGVEDQAQVDYLATLDCTLIQGYFYSPPKKLEDFGSLLDEDSPFANQLANDLTCVDSLVLSKADFGRFLKQSRGLHDTVRVLDFENRYLCVVAEGGKVEACSGNCYDAWNRDEHCANCTSRAVFEGRGVKRKFEKLGDDEYFVCSVYVEVDGEPRVVELIDRVERDVFSE